MNTYAIPADPRFDALRREAELYLCPAGLVPYDGGRRTPTLRVVAGEDESEGYTLERDGRSLLIHAEGRRGAAHGFHHALRLMGFGYSFFADATPRNPRLGWPIRGNTMSVEPAFAVRGMLPWGNLLKSINVWNFEDYERFLLTLWRWGGNFVWFHNYDADPYGAFRDQHGEWSHGKPYANSFDPPCGAKAGIRVDEYPHGTARHFKDARKGVWGARHAFARDPIAAAQADFARVITFAKSLGIDTAFGFELKGDPTAPGYRECMRRRIRHVLEAYPDLHTLCLWQAERVGNFAGWPMFVASPGYQKLHRRYAKHFRYFDHAPNRRAEGVRLATVFNWAYEIAREIRPSIRLAFSGWGGDRWLKWGDYWRGLHECLPADATLAQLDNILPRWQDHVSEAIRLLGGGRDAWTTLWIESDMGPSGYASMWHPQEDLAQFEKLVKSAAKLGYRGLFAQNWNTAGVEFSAAFIMRGAWTPTLTASDFRRGYSQTFYDTRRVAGVLEDLEALGPGWTGTSQQTEWTYFNWDSHPPIAMADVPAIRKLGEAIVEAREATYDAPFGLPYHFTSLLFHCMQQDAPADAFERLLAIRARFSRMKLLTPHARRLLATMDFVISYERIKRELDTRGLLAARQSLIYQAQADGLKPDPRLVAEYRRGLARVERLWKEVFRAQAARLDTRSDLGLLATINVKAYPKWQEFRAAIKV